MPHLYFDHDMSHVVSGSFRTRGEAITTARELGLAEAMDGMQLLTAARRGWLLVTHDQTHYKVLHDAWFRWGAAWETRQSHGGIVVLPHGAPSSVEQLLVTFLSTYVDFTDKLFEWRPASGWRVTSYRP
ncbi:MAG TPA: DUF5615 family PIN-like protein [Thermomicrobiales bacterium]|nr:DUF5615 family PIN-like protein [Thermomicrobiales bacterium]